jgi:hypothetical protein
MLTDGLLSAGWGAEICGAGATAVVEVGATTGSVVGGDVGGDAGRAVVVVVGMGLREVVVVVGGNVVDGASVGGVKRSGCGPPSTT